MLLFSVLSALPLYTLDFLPLSSAGQGHTHFAPLALGLFRDVTDNKKKMKGKKSNKGKTHRLKTDISVLLAGWMWSWKVPCSVFG